MNFSTCAQAAQHLNISSRRVRQMIADGLLPATKHGRDWLIKQAEIEKRLKNNPGPGRPKDKK